MFRIICEVEEKLPVWRTALVLIASVTIVLFSLKVRILEGSELLKKYLSSRVWCFFIGQTLSPF